MIDPGTSDQYWLLLHMIFEYFLPISIHSNLARPLAWPSWPRPLPELHRALISMWRKCSWKLRASQWQLRKVTVQNGSMLALTWIYCTLIYCNLHPRRILQKYSFTAYILYNYIKSVWWFATLLGFRIFDYMYRLTVRNVHVFQAQVPRPHRCNGPRPVRWLGTGHPRSLQGKVTLAT